MVRGKSQMGLIENEKLRNATFHKRKAGLKKKLREINILCDVDACMIVYGGPSDGKGRRVVLDTFPEKPDEVNRILARYVNGQGSGALISSKETNLSDFYENRARKINEDISKTRRAAYRAKYPGWNDCLRNASADQLKDVLCLLDEKIAYVNLLSQIGKAGTQVPFGSMMGIDHGGVVSEMMIEYKYNNMLSSVPQSYPIDDIVYHPKPEGNYENYQQQLDFNGIDLFSFGGCFDQTYMPVMPPSSSFDPSPNSFESRIHDDINFDKTTATNSFCMNGYHDQEEPNFTSNPSDGMLLPAVSSQLDEADFNEWGYIIDLDESNFTSNVSDGMLLPAVSSQLDKAYLNERSYIFDDIPLFQ